MKNNIPIIVCSDLSRKICSIEEIKTRLIEEWKKPIEKRIRTLHLNKMSTYR